MTSFFQTGVTRILIIHKLNLLLPIKYKTEKALLKKYDNYKQESEIFKCISVKLQGQKMCLKYKKRNNSNEPNDMFATI